MFSLEPLPVGVFLAVLAIIRAYLVATEIAKQVFFGRGERLGGG